MGNLKDPPKPPEAQDRLFRCGLPTRQPRASGPAVKIFFFGFFEGQIFFRFGTNSVFCSGVFWGVQIPPHARCF